MLAKRAITLVPNQHSAKGFHSSVQKGWWDKTHYKFEGTELIFTNSTFQDGGQIHAKGHPETRGLHVQCRAERCLFHGPFCLQSEDAE